MIRFEKTMFFVKLYVRFLVHFLNIDNTREKYNPGSICKESGKYFVLDDVTREVVSVSIDMEEGKRFPPTPVKDLVYVIYSKKK